MTAKNPMVSAQTYINKGWALQRLGDLDSLYKKRKKDEKNNQNPLTLLEKSGKIVERM